MTTTGLSGLDHSIEITHNWLSELMYKLDWADRPKAYHAMRAVLHALRDRLPINEAAHLGAQLPMVVRGFYYEGWRPTGKPSKARTVENFLEPIGYEFRLEQQVDPEQVTRAVFAVLAKHVSQGEIEDVKRTCLKRSANSGRPLRRKELMIHQFPRIMGSAPAALEPPGC